MPRKQIHLTPEEEAKLKRLARTTGRTEAEVLRLALDLLPEEEAPLLLALAEEELLEVPERAVTPAQMEEAYRRYLERVAGRRIGLSEAVLGDREGR
ncbi:CopG family transcriptional regulator [Thermus sp.]|uniref:CopG family transcriptional regulator n=1 Tax=Thermus sp. TaxID=275 RepID=UPI003D120EC1